MEFEKETKYLELKYVAKSGSGGINIEMVEKHKNKTAEAAFNLWSLF